MSGFRMILNRISQNIRQDELSRMKFMCADHIPKRKMEDIVTPLNLWEVLMEKEIIGPMKVEFIENLLVQIDRLDLLDLFNDLRRTGLEGPGFQDLTEEMNYVAGNIGRDWRLLARQLKIRDPDIQQIEESNPRNLREQSYNSLRLWQSLEKESATRDVLVKALRKCNQNLLADNIENGEMT